MIISAGASSLGAFFVAYGGRCFNFFKRYSVGRWIFLHIESTEKVEKRDLGAVSNGYKPPQNLNFIHYFYSFSVLSPLASFKRITYCACALNTHIIPRYGNIYRHRGI